MSASSRHETARGLRALARTTETTHPAIGTPGHLRDAARSLERGNTEGAQRHLRAALNLYTPHSLYRHGVLDDEGHTAARQQLAAVHRKLLVVKDIADEEAQNRKPAADPGQAQPQPGPPQFPPARRPAIAAAALSAPARQVVDLVGPKGYVHGWRYVGPEGGGPDIGAALGPAVSSAGQRLRHIFSGAKSALMAHMSAHHGGLPGSHDTEALHRVHDIQHAAGTAGHQHQMAAAQAATGRMMGMGMSWDDVAAAIELSAQTGRLAVTPHPLGKPGGPGLWDVKGMGLPPYIQNIAHALLRTGRAKTLSQAIAMAKAATSRWAHGKNTSPEVRAASAATNASWEAKRARAHASK